jgi:hypothetical protein
VEDEVREAMANGGIYVVAPADEAQELTQETAIGRAEEVLGGWLTTTAFSWVKGVWRTFGGGSSLNQVIWFVNRPKYKTSFCGLQNSSRGE